MTSRSSGPQEPPPSQGAPVAASTVAQRAVRGSIASSVSFLSSFAQTLVLVPILLQSWGAERYGLWLALQSLYGLVIALDTGHQAYVGNEFLRLYHTDRARLRSMLAAGLLGALLLGCFQLAVMLLLTLSGALPWALGQAGEVLPADAAPALAVLLSVWILYGSAGGILARLYPAAGQYARSVWWGIAYRVLVTTVIAAAVLAGAGVLGAVLASSAVGLVYVGFLWRDLRSRFSSLYPFWKGAQLRGVGRNIAHSVVVTGCAILAQLQQHGIVFVLSASVGLAIVPAYTTTRTLANVFLQAGSVVTSPLMPEMVRFSALGQHDKLADTLRSIWLVTGVPVNLGLCLGLPFYEPLYVAWTRGEMPFDTGLFSLLGVAISLRCFGSPLNALIAGLNALRAQVWINAGQSAVLLGALALAVSRFGLQAAGLAVALGELVGSVAIPIIIIRRLEPETMRRLPILSIALAVAPSVVVGSTLLSVSLGWLQPLTAMASGTLIAASLYALQWSKLAPHMQSRLLGLVRLRRRSARAQEKQS